MVRPVATGVSPTHLLCFQRHTCINWTPLVLARGFLYNQGAPVKNEGGSAHPAELTPTLSRGAWLGAAAETGREQGLSPLFCHLPKVEHTRSFNQDYTAFSHALICINYQCNSKMSKVFN